MNISNQAQAPRLFLYIIANTMIPFEIFRIPPRRGSDRGRISIITRPSALHERFGGSFGHWER